MRMFSAVSLVVLVVLAGVLSTGCLHKDVTQTIYISPDSVAWSVIEKDVRSDETAAAGRLMEEQDYLLAAMAGRHPAALAFRQLGAQAVTTTWLRRNRPFTVVTEARFGDPRTLAIAVLGELQARGDATLVRQGTRTTLTIRVEVGPESGAENRLDGLIADLDDYRIVLTAGRFVAADGFTIESDGAVAIPDSATIPEDGTLTLRLVWDDNAW